MKKFQKIFSLFFLIFFELSSSKKYFLSILGIFKNEAWVMREWIEHHISEGFEHFYLIDNGSNDNYEELIKDYLEQEIIYIKKDNRNLNLHQNETIVNFFFQFKNESEWILIMDLDEFAYARKITETVKSELIKNRYCDRFSKKEVGAIEVHWKTYTDSFYIRQPELIIPNFVYRIDPSKHWVFFFKTL